MDRRHFLLSTAAIGVAGPAIASSGAEYTPGLVRQELAAGKTVFVDFYTDWCSTCRAQQRVITALKSQNPEYEANITFVSVNWDDHRNSELSRSLNIPRRSTLVALRGDEELGRIVAGTSQSDIRALLDATLSAAIA